MKLIIKENSIVINKHSDGGKYNEYNNPFGCIIPSVGDVIFLGEHNPEWNKEYTPMRKYKVIGRSFSAVEDWNNGYTDLVCILNVEGYPNACFLESDYR